MLAKPSGESARTVIEHVVGDVDRDAPGRIILAEPSDRGVRPVSGDDMAGGGKSSDVRIGRRSVIGSRCHTSIKLSTSRS